MIYLFEDRKDRMNNLLDINIESYSDTLNYQKIIDTNKSEILDFFKDIKNLDIVILHKSYVFIDKEITPENIKTAVKRLNKKFVLFSGGIGDAIIDDNELMLNSGTLYNNLSFFLDNYKRNKDYSLIRLLYKDNDEYLKHQIKKYQNDVIPELLKLEYTENKEVAGKTFKQVVNKLNLYLKSEEFDSDKFKLSEYVKKRIEKKEFDHKILIQQIQKMVIKYENN